MDLRAAEFSPLKLSNFFFTIIRISRQFAPPRESDPDRLRNRLKTKLRARGIQKLNIPFRVRTNKRLAFSQNAV